MHEADFWLALKYRLCREFAGMPDNRLRGLWCDGFIPQRFLLDDPQPCITGRVWICSGPRQAEWQFTLFLPQRVATQDDIDWVKLMPADNVTRWLAVDPRRQRVEIEPSAAIPDANYDEHR